jgi:8-oxo-dGTP pyrophosphatase MutT (NUDIX family)
VSDSFHVEGAEVVFHSYVFDVERRTISHAEKSFERDVAVHAGAVAVLAINDQGQVGFIRQYRATFDDLLFEIPAGTRDKEGEEPLETAKRELLEEMGYAANDWKLLGRFMNSPGWTNQVMTIYEARDLIESDRAPEGPEERSSTIHWLTLDEIRQWLRSAPAIDSTTAIALHRVFGTFFDDI